MSKKEIHIFNVAFLDLLSGALAAVIILFVVIPKFTADQAEVLEAIEAMELEISQLDSLIQVAQNSIPAELYEQIQQQMQALQERVETLEEESMQQSRQMELCEQRSREMQERIEALQASLAAAGAGSQNYQGGMGAAMFGVNAKFAVVCDWQENTDVDLFMKNLNSGEWICYNCGDKSWGRYLGDVRSRRREDAVFEMIYQEGEIVPGNYEVWYHVYSPAKYANIKGYAIIFPFTFREQKIVFDNRYLQHSQKNPIQGGGVKVGVISLSGNSIAFN